MTKKVKMDIEKEAKRIINKILDIYNNRTKVNKYFYEIVFDLIPRELIKYKEEILIKTIRLIPLELTIPTDDEYVLITVEEDLINRGILAK